MERLNWLADTSANGLRQSAGIMINYLYKLGDIDDNHEAYTGAGKVAASSAIRSLTTG
jgi:malonyl-CoA decarboxylase